MNAKQIPSLIKDRFNAGFQCVWLVGEEFHRYLTGVQTAADEINKSPDKDRDVDVIVHDKVFGFYRGKPGILPPTDKTNNPLIALPFMMASTEDLKAMNSQYKFFNPEMDIIFVLKDWEVSWNGGDSASIVQWIRDMVHTNQCSDSYYQPDMKRGKRGKRMLVFVTATDKIPPTLPELVPTRIPLPTEEDLLLTVERVLKPVENAHKATKGAKGWVTPKEAKLKIARGLAGFTDQVAEDTLSLAVSSFKQLRLEDWLELFEDEKVKFTARLPGVTFISKSRLKEIKLAGYDRFIHFLKIRSTLDPETAAAHNLDPLKAFTLLGGPGLGKTMMGMLSAFLLDRPFLLISLGEVKGGIVGQSEAQLRMLLEFSNAIRALRMFDDIDKGMMGSGGQSGGYGGDGGTTENMLQMVLTELSMPKPKSITCFTANRVQNLKPELIRPGRMDGVFYIQRPDEATRFEVAKLHIGKRNFELDAKQLGRVQEITADAMEDWSPAEIESAVQEVAFNALFNKTKKLDLDLFHQIAKDTTPQARQQAYAEDYAAMERMAAQFIKVGRVEGTSGDGKASGGRADRSLI